MNDVSVGKVLDDPENFIHAFNDVSHANILSCL